MNHLQSNLNLVGSSTQTFKGFKSTEVSLFIKSELELLKRKPTTYNYRNLYDYATAVQKLLTFIGIALAVSVSTTYALDLLIYSEFTTLLVDRTLMNGTSQETVLMRLFGGGRVLSNDTAAENRKAIEEDSYAFLFGTLALAFTQLSLLATSVYLINYSALKQIHTIRKNFLMSIIRQDMSWYDLHKDDDFTVQITEDLIKVKEGISEKLTMFSFLIGSAVFSLGLSISYGWKLALVIMSGAPLILLATIFVGSKQNQITMSEMQAYGVAGSHAEEVLHSIRTVVAFGGEKTESKNYENHLLAAEKKSILKGAYTGIDSGLLWFLMYVSYALAMWYGIKLMIVDRKKPEELREYTPVVLIMLLLGVIGAVLHIGLALPHYETFNSAKGAAANIFEVIRGKPSIDPMSTGGHYPENIAGDIEFSRVYFRYPARPDIPILRSFTLSIPAGKTVALVGPSGCGKSTCLQLLQRLYDPASGFVSIDGYNINKLNVACLRSFIGVVGQEPVLFATTIGENIRYGYPDASQNRIEHAARIANCHNFIKKLPDGYNTMVGPRGAQLSGGQKQRIAIARALVRNPRILLLDEATSALDTNSEKLVQAALEKAMKGRTTLVVSHRLSTITDVDQIIYIQDGKVLEQGTHSELMQKGGEYFKLVNSSGSGTRKKRDTMTVTTESNVALVSTDALDQITLDIEIPDEQPPPVPMLKLMKLNAPEWPYILFGCLSAIILGITFPAFAFLYGEMYGVLSIQDEKLLREGGNFYSLMFVCLAIVSGLSAFLQVMFLNLAGIKLTSRLRVKYLEAMMNQEMAWFDNVKNSVGSLCARLSSDCEDVQGATGSRVGFILQAVSTIVTGVGIAIYISWKLTLISIACVPIILGTVFMETRMTATNVLNEKMAMEDGIKIAVEAISNIKTVASLGQEKYVIERFNAEMDRVYKESCKKSRYRGIILGFGIVIPHIGYGLTLAYGGFMVAAGEIRYQDLIKLSESLIFGAWMLGQALAYIPNIGAAALSASRIYQLFGRTPNYKNPSTSPVPSYWRTEGEVSYRDVKFRYPNRPHVPVLEGMSFNVESGQTIALVGQSGCGKSTCIQLLLRYYDCDSGAVTLDSRPTSEYPFNVIRPQLGLVSQEPVLFDRSIAENIAYGDNSRNIPMAEIIEAAKLANIHDFIRGLPTGYDTNLGARGANLSGGQKQRIAIARALVRDPAILLLDEATSALDNQSEQKVQLALDTAKKGRTCITIAHRLTTIQNSDNIFVFRNGVVVEQGKHEELIEKDGLYATLYAMQQIET